jgi:uncharacterized protein
MSRVVHFEIHAQDAERAKNFYGQVFGWEFQDWSHAGGGPYWGVVTGPDDQLGINGGLLERSTPPPAAGGGANSFVCTVQVDDYDATDRKILDAGGHVTVTKSAIPGMAWQGYYLDTEGNSFGIHQPDPDAS